MTLPASSLPINCHSDALGSSVAGLWASDEIVHPLWHRNMGTAAALFIHVLDSKAWHILWHVQQVVPEPVLMSEVGPSEILKVLIQ